MPLKSAEA